MSAIARTTAVTARTTFGTPVNRALLAIVVTADIILAVALVRREWVFPPLEYALLALIMAAVIRLAAIVCDPRQPRRGRDPDGSGYGWGGDAPWPPGTYIVLLLTAATAGIILTYTGLYWHFGMPGWQQGMLTAIGTISTVNGPSGGSSGFLWTGASQELIDLVFLSGVVTIALGRIR